MKYIAIGTIIGFSLAVVGVFWSVKPAAGQIQTCQWPNHCQYIIDPCQPNQVCIK